MAIGVESGINKEISNSQLCLAVKQMIIKIIKILSHTNLSGLYSLSNIVGDEKDLIPSVSNILAKLLHHSVHYTKLFKQSQFLFARMIYVKVYPTGI